MANNTSTTTTMPQVPWPDHCRSLWRSRLDSALRTSLACAIVGLTTLYGPTSTRRHLRFSAFSYMTAVLVVGESATLGNSLRGAAYAFYGIILGLLPAVMTFYVIRPEGVSATTTALAVAISSFVVAVTDSPGLITKRVALGQIVLVYVTAYKESGHVTPVVLHPVPVAASTGVGAVAAVLALVFPYPKLAYYQVREKSNLYTEMTTERLSVLINGFCAESSICMAAAECQSKNLAAGCRKLIRSIKLMQGSMMWERPPFKFLPPPSTTPWESLQAIETPLNGMEIALASTTSFPIKSVDQQVKDDLVGLSNRLSGIIRQNNFTAEREEMDKTPQSLPLTIPSCLQDLPSFFFLFCIKLLNNGLMTSPCRNSTNDSKVTPATEQTPKPFKEEGPSDKKKSFWTKNMMKTERFIIALKCSFTLGLAVLFGILFSKDDGYWSGLTVAIAFTPCGEATFKLASIRAHGTALGSVYGVLGSFISQNLMEVRLLTLLPWVVFTSFLQRSRMYGPVGALGATISAMIISGRKNYGSPMIFSVDRLTETYIGLCCSILVELILQPTRASTMARSELSGSLYLLRECLESVARPVESKEKEKMLRKRVNELRKCIGEAEMEPNFWFLPFPVATYNKLHGSLARMVDLVLFLTQSMEFLIQDSHGSDIQQATKGDLDHFKDMLTSSVKCFEVVVHEKSLERVGKHLRSKGSSRDIEQGVCSSCHGDLSDDERREKIVVSFLQNAREVMERLYEDVDGELKGNLVLSLSTVGFCIERLIREMRVTQKGILELVQWENPSCNTNVYGISCKLKRVST